jgi:hypothetical protein
MFIQRAIPAGSVNPDICLPDRGGAGNTALTPATVVSRPKFCIVTFSSAFALTPVKTLPMSPKCALLAAVIVTRF